MIEKKFIDESIKRLKTKEYIRKELAKAGIIDVNIQRTTLTTRIIITAERPGIVIGRKGRGIQELTQILEKDLGIEKPQIEIAEMGNPNLEPTVIGRWIARMLERGYKSKRAMQRGLERIRSANPMGAEIVIRGTMHKGSKARQERVTYGYLKKAGDSVKYVKEAKIQAILKQGVLGVTVRIVPPKVIFPDKINIQKIIKEQKMAIIKKKELRSLGNEELQEKLQQLRTELSTEKGATASGTRAENPGRIKEIKRTIARILTTLHEREVHEKK